MSLKTQQQRLLLFNDLILKTIPGLSIYKGHLWVAGGCIRDIMSSGKIESDIDIYFSSEEKFQIALDYFFKMQEEKKCELIFNNENVYKFKWGEYEFDIIRRVFKSPQECIKHFDFTACAAAFDGQHLHTHPDFFMDLARKELRIISLPVPISTAWRIQKYTQKGYFITKKEWNKVMKAVYKTTDLVDYFYYTNCEDKDFEPVSTGKIVVPEPKDNDNKDHSGY